VSALAPSLLEFLFRLSAGLALAMLITSSRQVTSGFFRIQSWVLMGLATFASLVLYSQASQYKFASVAIGISIAAAVVSYISAVIWMYEGRVAGKIALMVVAALFVAAEIATALRNSVAGPPTSHADFASGGILLGSFLAAMLLGHWYLNFPGMPLAPLQKLVLVCGLAVLLRALFSAAGLIQLAMLDNLPDSTITWSLLVFRWLAGLIGPGVMAYMAWQTLKIPNTQSATGILYAAVTLTFLGELTAQLLSRGLPVPI
jgi:hypothetical protein